MLPSAEALHLRRVRGNVLRVLCEKIFLEAAKAEERAAAGRMKSPEAVTEQRRDTRRKTHARAKFSSVFWLRKSTAIAATFGLPKAPIAERSPSLSLRLGRLVFACSTMHSDRWEKAAGVGTRAGIAKPLGNRVNPLTLAASRARWTGTPHRSRVCLDSHAHEQCNRRRLPCPPQSHGQHPTGR